MAVSVSSTHRALRLVENSKPKNSVIRLPPSRAPPHLFGVHRSSKLFLIACGGRDERMMTIISAQAHVEIVVLRELCLHTSNLSSSPINTVLVNLRSLFALSTITNPTSINAISFVEDGYLSSQISRIRTRVNELLDVLKRDLCSSTNRCLGLHRCELVQRDRNEGRQCVCV
jgi:hypothetical protein